MEDTENTEEEKIKLIIINILKDEMLFQKKPKTPKRIYFKRPFRKQEHLLDIQNMMTEIKNSRKGLVDEVEEIPQ